MTAPTPRTWATINLNALKFNLARVADLCPHSSIVPVIKSNGYGHGMAKVAQSMIDSDTQFKSFVVATLQEAIDLEALKLGRSIVLLSGFANEDELRLCLEKKIQPVIHSQYQVALATNVLASDYQDYHKTFWIEFNTGMNRLGQRKAESLETYRALAKLPSTNLVFMSHLAFADDMALPASRIFTGRQVSQFCEVRKELSDEFSSLKCSLAASAGILTLPETHHDVVRPGVMLYGSSPLSQENGLDVGLQPVMTLKARIIAINEVKAGEAIGYGATYVCPEDTRIAVVSIGYGDGYPRSTTRETPVVIQSASGSFRAQVVGRVSMDMITVDLGVNPAEIGNEVILWGEGLCADDVARTVGTIAYELFCKVTNRVKYHYID